MSELEIIEIARQRADAAVAPARAEAFERALRELRAEAESRAGGAGAPADPDEDGLWTVDQVAEYLGQHPNTIYRLAKDGELKSVRLGPRTIRFRKADVDDFLGRAERRPSAQIMAFARRRRE